MSLAFNPEWVQVQQVGNTQFACAFCGYVFWTEGGSKHTHDTSHPSIRCVQEGMSFIVPPIMFLAQKTATAPEEQPLLLPLSQRPIDNATGCDSGGVGDHASK